VSSGFGLVVAPVGVSSGVSSGVCVVFGGFLSALNDMSLYWSATETEWHKYYTWQMSDVIYVMFKPIKFISVYYKLVNKQRKCRILR